MRRCTRLTNGFSKKLENHEAAVSPLGCFYNFCRVHETLRCTPAMELGVTEHIWIIGELVAEALKSEEVTSRADQHDAARFTHQLGSGSSEEGNKVNLIELVKKK
jgi:hypothetical protein